AQDFPGLRPDEMETMQNAIAALEAAGAVVVDPADFPSTLATDPVKNLGAHNICQMPGDGDPQDDYCSHVLQYGMKRDFNLWLASLGDTAPVKTLTELREWNIANEEYGSMRYGQARLDYADSVDLEADKARYERNRAEDLQLTREEGIDAVLTEYNLDALMFPGSSGTAYATKAGYPIVVVPFGLVTNPDDPDKSQERTSPFGVNFVGGHCEDPKIIGIAYAFEQATKTRVPPPHTP
ncbi:MAG: hypothetical protein RLN70_09795, partial [Rhodospirillaceae bacterium]